MKAVAISIQPKWVEKILNGEKTIEVRKTAPKLEPLFKCYLYCTMGNPKKPADYLFINYEKKPVFGEPHLKRCCNGKVVAEFVCDRIFDICIEISSPDDLPGYPFPCTGMTDKEILQYLGNGKTGYGWNISRLLVYDKPMELGNFNYACDKNADTDCTLCAEQGLLKCKPVTRPPQSWCYVEELHNGQ